MPRFFRFLSLILLLVAFLCVAVYADNTVGELQSDCQFVGVTYYQYWKNSDIPLYWAASDDVIGKTLAPDRDISLTSSSYVYYFWRIPDSQDINLSVSLGLAADFPIQSVWVYLANYNSSNNFDLSSSYITLTNDQYFFDYHDGLTHVNIDDFFVDQNLFSSSGLTFDYLCIVFKTSSDSSTLTQSLTFSEAVLDRSFRLSPSASSSSVSLSGRVGFGSLPSTYISGTSPSYNTVSSSLFSIAPSSSGSSVSGAKFVSSTVLSNIFGSSSTLTSSSNTVIRTADSGTVSNPSYDASYTSGGSISASASSDVLFYGSARAWYGDDGGLVDEVFSIGDDVEGIAGNMQIIIDDMQASKETAAEIGGTTSASQVSGTQETLSSGTSSLGSLTDTATGQLQGVLQGASGYLSLVNMAVPVLFEFGSPSGVRPLLIALLVMVSVSALAFLFRRLL